MSGTAERSPTIIDVIVEENDPTLYKNGNILLHDLVCLHHILWHIRVENSSSSKAPLCPMSDAHIDELSKRFYQILTNGHECNIADYRNQNNDNAKGTTRRFMTRKSDEWNKLDFNEAKAFLVEVIRTGVSTKEADDLSPMITLQKKQALTRPIIEEKSSAGTPEPYDILTLERGARIDRGEVKAGVGNSRFIGLADEYIRTCNSKDSLCVSTSIKRAEAALAIMDLSRDPVDPPQKSPSRKGPLRARFLVRGNDGWSEMDNNSTAELSLLLLFDKFVEKEGKDKESSACLELSGDFTEPGKTLIEEPATYDVLFGRGGLTNNHLGNRRFRDVIALNRCDYYRAIKIEKPNVARRIVKAIRSGSPSGRFLKKNSDDMWYDVGDRHASEKTSQALRERTKSEKLERMKIQKKNDHDISKKKRDSGDVLPSNDTTLYNKRPRTQEPPSNIPTMTNPSYLGIPAGQGMNAPSQYGAYGMALRLQPLLNNGADAATTIDASQFGKNGQSINEAKGDISSYVRSVYELPADECTAPHRPYDDDGNILVTDHDILCGRGGLTNHHKGNKRFRDVVSLHRPDYVAAAKVQKPAVARMIVAAIRSGNPPGRFLKKHDKTGEWFEIGDKLAAEKASQALREKPSVAKDLSKAAGATLVPRLPGAFLGPYSAITSGAIQPQNIAQLETSNPPSNAQHPADATKTADNHISNTQQPTDTTKTAEV